MVTLSKTNQKLKQIQCQNATAQKSRTGRLAGQYVTRCCSLPDPSAAIRRFVCSDRSHSSVLVFRSMREFVRLVGLMVRCPPQEPQTWVRIPLAPWICFPGRVTGPVTIKLVLQWLPCRASGIAGSALGLAGPVSVYCDWVRQKVWSAASVSVWQRVWAYPSRRFTG